jgi:ferric-dicitrate binding protein FerR (iron transport regulator)
MSADADYQRGLADGAFEGALQERKRWGRAIEQLQTELKRLRDIAAEDSRHEGEHEKNSHRRARHRMRAFTEVLILLECALQASENPPTAFPSEDL